MAEKKKALAGASQMTNTRKKNNLDKDVVLNSFGGSGTALLNGFIEEEFNSKLKGSEGVKKFDEMRRTDAQVNAILMAMELPIRSTRWYVEPSQNKDGETDDAAWEVADFVEKAIFDGMETTWDDTLREMLTMLPFGFSVFEKVYKIKEDKITLKKLGYRKQSSIHKWETEEGGAGVTQYLVTPLADDDMGAKTVSIPAEKLLIFSYRREGDNYEGISVLRSAYKHWYIKDKLYKFDAVRHERQSVGIPVITLPDGATDVDKQEALTIVTNIRSTEQTGIVLPGEKWKFEFADTKASQSTDLFESIKHHNREIAKNILAQFLELGDTSSGSRSLGDSQTDMFLQSLEAVAKQICDTINRFLIPELVDFNFDVEAYPQLKFDPLAGKDLEKLANIISTLIGAAAINPDEDLEDFLREKYELPARMKEEEVDETDDGEDEDPMDDEGDDTDGDDGGDDGGDMPDNTDDLDALDAELAKMSEDHQCGHGCSHGETVGEFDEYYFAIGSLINNKHILSLQNEAREAHDFAEIKSKGWKLNEYEKDAWRPMTFAERKVNFLSLNRSVDTFEQMLDEKLNELAASQKEELLLQIKKAVEANDIAAVGKIKAKYTSDIAQLLTDIQKEMFEIGKKSAAVEMSVQVPATKAEVRGALRVQNDTIVDSITNDIETASKSAVTQVAAKRGGSITATTAAEAVAAASASLDVVYEKAKNAMKGLVLIGSINLGRASIFERYPEKIYAMQYSAILDSRTTETCRSLDGRIVFPGSPEFYKYSPPRHYGCRSLWVEILQEETFKPKITGIPSSIPSNATVDTFKDLKSPVILKGSPVVKVIQEEIADRKTKIAELETSGKYQNRIAQHQARIDELEKSLESAFSEHFKEILKADGVSFKE